MVLDGVGTAGKGLAGSTVEGVAAVSGGGGTPAALGGGGQVGELHHGERKLATGSTREERGRRWGLRGELEHGGGNGGLRRLWARRELWLGLRGEESGEGGCGHCYKANEGGEAPQRGGALEWRRCSTVVVGRAARGATEGSRMASAWPRRRDRAGVVGGRSARLPWHGSTLA